MTDPAFRSRVDRALDEARALLAFPGPRGAREALAGALAAFDRNRARWDGRLRVALVGRVSSGKSTLVNALLGEDLAETAVKELTSVVTWLRHAPAPALTVSYKGSAADRQVIPPTLAALADLTTHHAGPGGEAAGFADDADFVTYEYPNDRLRAFDLIDTPGLRSVLGTDSDNTLRHLGPRVDTADALVLVFERGLHKQDEELLAHFQRANEAGTADVSPLTCVAALTQVEREWKAREPLMTGGRLTVLAQGEQVAERLMRLPGPRRLLYETLPVASKIGAAAGTCDDGDLAALTELATTIKPGELPRLVSNADKWAHRDLPGVTVPAPRRESLYEKLTACGIVLSCHLIREGADTLPGLRDRLRHYSGLDEFRDTLAGHFGQRADPIKLIRLIERTSAMAGQQRVTLAAKPLDALDGAVRKITDLALSEPAFGEMTALRAHYNDRLQLSEEETREMLRLFGERPRTGPSVADRLGMPGAPASVLADHAVARSAHWRRQADLGPYHSDTREACRAMSRTYNHLRLLLAEDVPGQPR